MRFLREILERDETHWSRFAKGAGYQLADHARKSGSFDEFEKGWLRHQRHGLYWHVTDNPHFSIDPSKGPRDMSSMADGKMAAGDAMITSDLGNWKDHYGKNRHFAAMINTTKMHPSELKQISRGFGNEFYVQNAPSKLSVAKVMPIKQAMAYDRHYDKSKPQSREELQHFYNSVRKEG